MTLCLAFQEINMYIKQAKPFLRDGYVSI